MKVSAAKKTHEQNSPARLDDIVLKTAPTFLSTLS